MTSIREQLNLLNHFGIVYKSSNMTVTLDNGRFKKVVNDYFKKPEYENHELTCKYDSSVNSSVVKMGNYNRIIGWGCRYKRRKFKELVKLCD